MTPIFEITDEIEYYAIVDEDGVVSRSSILTALRRAPTLGSDDAARGQFPDLESHALAILAEMRRRATGDYAGYPFSPDGDSLDVGEHDVDVYEFLLHSARVTSCLSRSAALTNRCNGLFDELAMRALRGYVGATEGMAIGSPRPPGLPKAFDRLVRNLARRMHVPLGHLRAGSHTGDGGVDCVVWSPHTDSRPGFIVVLGQCTIRDGWTTKGRDLEADVWRGYLALPKDPLLALVSPSVLVPPPGKDGYLSRSVNVVLDRLRLSHLLCRAQGAIDLPTRKKLRAFNRDMRKKRAGL